MSMVLTTWENLMTLNRRIAEREERIAELEAERNNTAAHVASIARQLGDESLQVDDIAVRVLRLVAEADKANEAVVGREAGRDELSARLDAAPVPAQAAPKGWRLVQVKSAEFDELMYWLERCGDKGHLERCSDLIEPWAAFDYREIPASPEAAR